MHRDLISDSVAAPGEEPAWFVLTDLTENLLQGREPPEPRALQPGSQDRGLLPRGRALPGVHRLRCPERDRFPLSSLGTCTTHSKLNQPES